MRFALASLSSNYEPRAASRLCRWLCLLVSFAGLIPLNHAMEFGERVGPVELITLDGRGKAHGFAVTRSGRGWKIRVELADWAEVAIVERDADMLVVIWRQPYPSAR